MLLMLLTLGGLSAVTFGAADETALIGDGNDGNLSTPVHRFELFDENGVQIRAADKNPRPFSIEKTCGQCHSYETIAQGWHFNGHDPAVEAGRCGQPWVLTDAATRTQIPLTARQWPGTYAPAALGVSPWEFLQRFYSHFPGGSYGQMEADNPEEGIRQGISGFYEINCLACHHNSYQEDQSLAALQAARQNYRWIPTASSGKAVVGGVALSLDDFFDPEFDDGLTVTYNDGVFDSDDMVTFEIGLPDNNRCYFCHSDERLGVEEAKHWTLDEDVHLQAGLNCIDCHRNGDDHRITRGIETDGPGATLTCQGCHLGSGDNDTPQHGRLAAPVPQHRGIPTIHFEALTCTACHSGTWPDEAAGRWKTARMHKTGLHGKHHLEISQPHLYAPVLMKNEDGQIAPHKLFWPAFWATVDGETVTPIPPEAVLAAAGTLLQEAVERVDDWRPLTEPMIAAVLSRLNNDDTAAGYVAGGKLYRLDGETLTEADHTAAQPYAWPLAHDVRPAAQSTGVRLCQDCHTTDSPFFFGTVEVDTPVRTEAGLERVEMIRLQGIDRLYMWAFNASFVFRPMLKIVAFAACGLIALVVLAYVLRAVAALSNACAERSDDHV